jgi:hypothetical protein
MPYSEEYLMTFTYKKVAIKEVKTPDEAKALLSQTTMENEVFIKLDWEGTKYKLPILE